MCPYLQTVELTLLRGMCLVNVSSSSSVSLEFSLRVVSFRAVSSPRNWSAPSLSVSKLYSNRLGFGCVCARVWGAKRGGWERRVLLKRKYTQQREPESSFSGRFGFMTTPNIFNHFSLVSKRRSSLCGSVAGMYEKQIEEGEPNRLTCFEPHVHLIRSSL